MRITHIANACCIYESQGKKLISDPWLTEGAFEGSWGHFPDLVTKPEHIKDVDAMFISHLHPDHFDPQTISVMRKDLPIFILNRPKKTNYLANKLKALGFTNLQLCEDGKIVNFGPFELTIYAPFCSHPFDHSELGNFIDSALVVKADGQVVLNANDNTPDLKAALKLRLKHGPFTVAQLKESLASPYPQCFSNLSVKQKQDEVDRLIDRQLKTMIAVAKALQAQHFQPFAGSYHLIGSLASKNFYLGLCPHSKVINDCRAEKVNHLIMKEGDSIDLTTNTLTYKSRPFISYSWWAERKRHMTYPYESDPYPVHWDLKDGIIRAIGNLKRKQRELDYHPDLLLEINSADVKVAFSMRDDYERPVNYMRCTIDSRLLWRIIEKKAHWNNAEVGSHIEFYREPNKYEPDLVTIMSYFHG